MKNGAKRGRRRRKANPIPKWDKVRLNEKKFYDGNMSRFTFTLRRGEHTPVRLLFNRIHGARQV
jgi:hypothetical protein